jgi:hypothetical protein
MTCEFGTRLILTDQEVDQDIGIMERLHHSARNSS